tara:strand:- start:14 stop:289 length:276 start_codon:yes stop_codon:yes gene_type:complete
MTTTKKEIAKILSKNVSINLELSSKFIDTFLALIKNNSKSKVIKINGFGSFRYKKTPQRIGRNPKTKESYIIQKSKRFVFTVSNKIKEILN